MIKHAVERAERRPGRDRGRDPRLRRCRKARPATTSPASRRCAPALPVTVAGMTVNRFCSSGLQAIAMAAQRVHRRQGAGDGRRRRSSRSRLVQNDRAATTTRTVNPWVQEHKPGIYMPMIADRRHRGRALQASAARRRTSTRCRASSAPPRRQQAGKFDDEIVPMDDHDAGHRQGDRRESSKKTVTLDQGRGQPPRHHARGPAELKPVARRPGKSITAGNASQLSDGASACVVMSDAEAAKRGLTPLGIYRGLASPAASPTRWASARSSRSPSCSSATASRSTTSTCGS